MRQTEKTPASPTPGPWMVRDGSRLIVPVADAHKAIGGSVDPEQEHQRYAKVIARISINEFRQFYRSRPVKEEAEANARLIAAAPLFAAACTPERLASLETTITRLGSEDVGDGAEAVTGMMEYAHLVDLLRDLREATAKATTGGTP